MHQKLKAALTTLGITFAPISAAQTRSVPLNPSLPFVNGKGSTSMGANLKKYDLTIIQFWASWCVGCGDVMAQLAKRSKQDSTVGYSSISIDEDMPTARRYFASKPPEVKAAMPNALLDAGGERIATPLKIKSLPVVIIAARDGQVVELIAGHPKPQQLTDIIAKYRAKNKK